MGQKTASSDGLLNQLSKTILGKTMTNLDYTKTLVYFRDRFVPFDDANVSIGSSPVLYGLSVYTVFNVTWDEKKQQLLIFRLKDHYKRLMNSANIMDFHGFKEQWSYEKFEETMHDLLKKNNIQENVLIRVTVFVDELIAGTKIHGLKHSMSAFVYPFGKILPPSGAHVCVSSWQRTADNAIPSRAKVNGSYINASLMKNEALMNGYDDALAIDEHGHVAEGTVANFFMVRDGVLITPDASTDILEGITRDTIIRYAKDQNVPLEIRSIDRSELYMADEAFLSGSSANVTPILSIDKRVIGSGKKGTVTEKIGEFYDRVRAGKEPAYSNWLTVV